MFYYNKNIDYALKNLNSDLNNGLTESGLVESIRKYGKNKLTEKRKKGILSKILDCLKEPMMLILLFGFVLTLGINIGKFLKIGEGDFTECVGILFAIALSVSINLIMERSSFKAFAALNKIYDNVAVRVIRNGKIMVISQQDIAVGDIMFVENGDKIIADGRIVESNSLMVDESALTGESNSLLKNANVILQDNTPLAERKNCVYSGTFVTGGNAKVLITSIGDNTEIGKIAKELSDKSENTPLQQKLTRLGKIVTITGIVCALVVLALSTIKLILTGNFSFSNMQELIISCIILIVAAVPEGLPTIVAISLALNMIKLAKEKALIRKISATETAGAVSVICSDKTGTITENKMKVVSVCLSEYCLSPENLTLDVLHQNFVCNSTAEILIKNSKFEFLGSGTECALLNAYKQSNSKYSCIELRNKYKKIESEPFSSDKKYMKTTVRTESGVRCYLKGAPEHVLNQCILDERQKMSLLRSMEKHQKKARRILCFAHCDDLIDEGKLFIYDGYVAIEDPIRREVYKAVKDCHKAGIKIKILTGDNIVTAFAIAKELGIASDESNVALATDLEKLDNNSLKNALSKITVVARSTPTIKLKIVKLLKEMNEVVAVTGDGINDAPAIKHADIGISMGITGSEITKEASDVILLDDSFATVVKAISFGRNVYKNLQRFILFQLSVNLSALLFITICAVIGISSPFNTFQLLWINVIMDGPPALTLGLEKASDELMNLPPVKRIDNIIDKKMFLRIVFNSLFISSILIIQYFTNFLGALDNEKGCLMFTLFILFQLFNAFNCRELGADSILKSYSKNKIMVLTFLVVFIIHFLIVQFCPFIFCIEPMRFIIWIRTTIVAFSIILVSELYKLMYRLLREKNIINKLIPNKFFKVKTDK